MLLSLRVNDDGPMRVRRQNLQLRKLCLNGGRIKQIGIDHDRIRWLLRKQPATVIKSIDQSDLCDVRPGLKQYSQAVAERARRGDNQHADILSAYHRWAST
jgi:hypothetical protein